MDNKTVVKKRAKKVFKIKKNNPLYASSVSSSPLTEISLFVYDLIMPEKREGQRTLLEKMAMHMDKVYKRKIQYEKDKEDGIETDISLIPMDIVAAEAPVGTGKSYVLLLLSFLSWYIYGKNSVISTQTKILQNQFFVKDIPEFKNMLMKLTEQGILEEERVLRWRYHIVKGRNNYICPACVDEYMQLSAHYGDILLSPVGTSKRTHVNYSSLVAKKTLTENMGRDMDKGLFENDPLYNILSASECNCIKHYEDCSYVKNMKCPYKAALILKSPLIIANHSLIQSMIGISIKQKEEKLLIKDEEGLEKGHVETQDINDKELITDEIKSPLLSADNYFFDESHHLMGYSSGIGRSSESVFTDDIKKFLSFPLPSENNFNKKGLNAILTHRERIWALWQELLISLQDCITDYKEIKEREYEKTGSSGGGKSFKQYLSEDTKGFPLIISEASKEIGIVLRLCSKLPTEYRNEAEECMKNICGTWKSVVEGVNKGLISPSSLWMDINDEGISWTTSEAKSLQNEMIESVSFEFAAFISGTLLINNNAEVFKRETGINSISEIIKVESPFTHANIHLWVPKSHQIPPPIGEKLRKAHNEAVIKFCYDYVPPYVSADLGGVLILCTSVQRMNSIAGFLSGPIKKTGRQLLVQGRSPRAQLVRSFLNNSSSVLVATNSFREGFDAVGEKLTWVIMDKLPFMNPVQTDVKIRMDNLKKHNVIENEISHAADIMQFSLTQSIGRLERSEGDWGTVTILDRRFYQMLGERSEYPDDIDEAKKKKIKEMYKDIDLRKSIPLNWDISKIQSGLPSPQEWIKKSKEIKDKAESYRLEKLFL